MRYIITICLTFFIIMPVMAAPYDVDMNQSTISFKGQHAGNDFTGAFQDWQARIDFDNDDLANSMAVITIHTKSARTSNPMFDGTLPTGDWFNSIEHPIATFRSTNFTATDNGFTVVGDLTIRGITRTIHFPFSLEEDESTIMTASFPINRLDYGIGQKSDPSAEWVSDIITISLTVHATQVPDN